jgi:hypothetical protein
LIDLGVFHKVDNVSPTSVRVYVMPEAFNSLRFETKQRLSSDYTKTRAGTSPARVFSKAL